MKLFFNFLLLLYLVATGGYFAYKYLVSSKSVSIKQQTVLKQQKIEEPKIPDHKVCVKYLMAYYVAYNDTFRARIENSCLKGGDLALAVVNSEATAVLSFDSYTRAKTVAKDANDEVYAVFTVAKPLQRGLEDGDYATILFNYDLSKFTDAKEYTVSKDDRKLVERLSDTIYYLSVDKKTAFNTKLEYEILKVDIDKYRPHDLIALVNWFPRFLPKGIRYTSLFALYRGAGNVKRYDIIPITKTRHSYYSLFQVVDIDADGVKELIIKKERKATVSFLIYKFNKDFTYKKVDEVLF